MHDVFVFIPLLYIENSKEMYKNIFSHAGCRLSAQYRLPKAGPALSNFDQN